MEETKRCKICGEEKPLNKFRHWKNKDGVTCYSHQCRVCEERKYKHRKKIKDGATYHLARYSDAELIYELNMRGYAIEDI